MWIIAKARGNSQQKVRDDNEVSCYRTKNLPVTIQKYIITKNIVNIPHK